MRTQFPLPGTVTRLPYDPRGAQVVMRRMGRDLLGDVRDAYRDPATGTWYLRVTFFNGEPWPANPNIGAVEVLIRTYTQGED